MAIVTKVNWGREITEAEVTSIRAYAANAVTAGTTDGVWYIGQTTEDTLTTTQLRVWTTTDAANGFIAVVNAFSPAPTSAEVI